MGNHVEWTADANAGPGIRKKNNERRGKRRKKEKKKRKIIRKKRKKEKLGEGKHVSPIGRSL
jgi:hypothetical protein